MGLFMDKDGNLRDTKDPPSTTEEWFEIHSPNDYVDDGYRHEPCADRDCPGPEPIHFTEAEAREAVAEARADEVNASLWIEKHTLVVERVADFPSPNPDATG